MLKNYVCLISSLHLEICRSKGRWRHLNEYSIFFQCPVVNQVATDGDSAGEIVRELRHLINVQFYSDFFFIYVPFSLLSLCYAHVHDRFISLQFFLWFLLQPHLFYPLFFSYLYITFAMLLPLGVMCDSKKA